MKYIFLIATVFFLLFGLVPPAQAHRPTMQGGLDVGLSLPVQSADGVLDFKFLVLYGTTPGGPLPILSRLRGSMETAKIYFEDIFPKFRFSYDILGPYDIPPRQDDASCSYRNIGPILISRATAAGVNISDYSNAFYLYNVPGCPISGAGISFNQAELSNWPYFYNPSITVGERGSIVDWSGALLHEIAHGLWHPSLNTPATYWGLSHSIRAQDGCIGIPFDLFNFDPIPCTINSNQRDVSGDLMTSMDTGLNAPNRYFFNAFFPSDIIEINSPSDFTAGREYRLSPLDTGGPEVGGRNYPGPHVIKINRSDGSFIMLSFRKKEGWDNSVNIQNIEGKSSFSGASVHYNGWNNPDLRSGIETRLLKILANGDYLTLGSSGLRLQQMSYNDNGVTLKVCQSSGCPLTPTPSPTPGNEIRVNFGVIPQ